MSDSKPTWSPFVAIFVFLAGQAITLFKWGIETQSILSVIKDSTIRHEALILDLAKERYTQDEARTEQKPVIEKLEYLDRRVSTLEQNIILRSLSKK